jgi:hypothetical protein
VVPHGFVDCVRVWIGEGGGVREFFNPFLNDRYNHILKTNFGADTCTRFQGDNFPRDYLESLNTVVNIFRPTITDDDIQNAIMNTWCLENYVVTKEVWILQRLRVMKSMFQIVGLSRATQYTFPGSFPPLNEYLYLRLYESLLHNFSTMGEGEKNCLRFLLENCRNNQSKICGTHLLCMEMLRRNCKSENIPVIDYEDLICLDKSQIESLINISWPKFPYPTALARVIVDTREPREFLESRSNKFFKFVDRAFFEDFRTIVDESIQIRFPSVDCHATTDRGANNVYE